MGNVNPAGAGNYGYQAAIKAQSNQNAANENIRITPKNTVKKDGSYTNEGVQNFLGYAQEDMKLVDGNNGSNRDGLIDRQELNKHFRGGLDDPSINSFSDARAGKFMEAYDQNKNQQLDLGEMTARLMTEASPKSAFSDIIAKEKADMPSIPGYEMPTFTEMALNKPDIANDGVSSPSERNFLNGQVEDGRTNAGKAAKNMTEKYNLTEAAKKFQQ